MLSPMIILEPGSSNAYVLKRNSAGLKHSTSTLYYGPVQFAIRGLCGLAKRSYTPGDARARGSDRELSSSAWR